MIMTMNNPPSEPPIKERYTEYTTEYGIVVEIADPDNNRAWIRSTISVTLDA